MAYLTTQQLSDVRASFMRDRPDNAPCTIDKVDLLAAFTALDHWLDDNAATVNNALPAAAKNGLTTKEKARLFRYVVYARYEAA